MKDYYEILEVHPKASNEIIRKAYLTLAKKYHPDTTDLDKDSAQKKMKELNEAFTVLGNTIKRRDYDKGYFKRNTVNKEGNKAENEHNRTSGGESIDDIPAVQFIMQIGKMVLEELDTKIVRKTGNEISNRVICDRLDEKISSNFPSAIKVIEETLSEKRDIYYFLGVIYWQMAAAYTWTNNRQGPIKYIELADKYVCKEMDCYENYQKTRKVVLHNEEINQKNEEMLIEEAQKEESRGCLGKLSLLFLVLLGIYVCWGGMVNDNSTRTSAQTQQKNNIRPIAKKGVVTGYDSDHPVLNEDGLSTLTIDNSRNDMPVYVRVWSIDSGQPVRAFYIRQGEKFTAEDMTAGNYQVRYKELYENKIKAKAAKSEPFDLEEYKEGRTIHYSNMSLTLYKVRNGNTSTTDIDENDV